MNTADCSFYYVDTDLGKSEIAANSTSFYGRTVGSNITINGADNTNMSQASSVKIGGVTAKILDKTN